MALPVMTPIDVTLITDATLEGPGIFDQFMKSMRNYLTVEYDTNRINSDQYPTIFLGMMQTALTQAVTFALQRPLLERQADSETAKKALIERQTKGFDDDAKQKLLKQSLDSWAVAYSVAQDANSIPDAIKIDVIDEIMYNSMKSLNIMPTTPATTADGTVLDNNPLGVANYASGTHI